MELQAQSRGRPGECDNRNAEVRVPWGEGRRGEARLCGHLNKEIKLVAEPWMRVPESNCEASAEHDRRRSDAQKQAGIGPTQ